MVLNAVVVLKESSLGETLTTLPAKSQHKTIFASQRGSHADHISDAAAE